MALHVQTTDDIDENCWTLRKMRNIGENSGTVGNIEKNLVLGLQMASVGWFLGPK